jgi:hypothetical protein
VHVADGLVKDRVKDRFLVIKKKVIANVRVQQALMLVLFASFYAFNVHYPPGCCNFYLLLECLAFMINKKLPERKSRLV